MILRDVEHDRTRLAGAGDFYNAVRTVASRRRGSVTRYTCFATAPMMLGTERLLLECIAPIALVGTDCRLRRRSASSFGHAVVAPASPLGGAGARLPHRQRLTCHWRAHNLAAAKPAPCSFAATISGIAGCRSSAGGKLHRDRAGWRRQNWGTGVHAPIGQDLHDHIGARHAGAGQRDVPPGRTWPNWSSSPWKISSSASGAQVVHTVSLSARAMSSPFAAKRGRGPYPRRPGLISSRAGGTSSRFCRAHAGCDRLQ